MGVIADAVNQVIDSRSQGYRRTSSIRAHACAWKSLRHGQIGKKFALILEHRQRPQERRAVGLLSTLRLPS